MRSDFFLTAFFVVKLEILYDEKVESQESEVVGKTNSKLFLSAPKICFVTNVVQIIRTKRFFVKNAVINFLTKK